VKIYQKSLRVIFNANNKDPLLRYLTGQIQNNITYKQPCKIVDFGCGTGRNVLMAAKRGCLVTGIDINKKALQIARDEVKRLGVDRQVTLMTGDINKLVLKHKLREFDYCILSEVVEHTNEYQKIIESAGNTLRKGGILILTTPNNMSQWSVLDEFAEHIHRFSINEIKSLLPGFRAVKLYTVGFPFMRLFIFIYTRLTRIFGIRHDPEKYWRSSVISTLYTKIGSGLLAVDSFFNFTPWGTNILVVFQKK
jgi:2-polyprenyl-3-methyl-5-hydroxy-6-metoxy-1,4-benzoquinol methylase